MSITEEQLAHALTGMLYPARRWQTIAWADFNCTSDRVRDALRQLPELIYANFGEVVGALPAIDEVGAGGVPRAATGAARSFPG